MMAHRNWWIDEDGQPGSVLRECLHAAVAAPSIHNTQPWLFRISSGGVDILADRGRRLRTIDPRGRELAISVGAALFNLRVAIRAHGRMPVTRVVPMATDPDLMAQVRLGPPAQVTESVRSLTQAIPLRHTNRRPFDGTAVPAEALAELVAAAAAEGGRLALASPDATEALLSLTRTAEKHQRLDPAYWNEISGWTRQFKHRRDGVPPEAYGPWSAMETVPIRDFGLVEPARKRGIESFEHNPTIGVLYSVGDSPRDWVGAGQALERVLLTATVRGLATTPMTQATEVAHIRGLLTDRMYGRQPQALIRFGYGRPSPATPRRPLADVIITTAPKVLQRQGLRH